MTQFINLRTFLAASAVLGATGLTLFSHSVSAEAASGVMACRGATKDTVVSCCEHEVRENGKPIWMRRAERNCSTSVVCKASGASKGSTAVTHAVAPAPQRCKIVMFSPVDRSNGNGGNRDGGKSHDGGRQGGGQSSSPTHGKP